jgi:hypothetical protein
MSKHQDRPSWGIVAWHAAAALAVIAVLVAGSTPPAISGASLKNKLTTPSIKHDFEVNHGRLCHWFENNGTSFGKSGNCHWSDDAQIGSPCTCEHTEEHNHIVHNGTVIEKPVASEAPSQPH